MRYFTQVLAAAAAHDMDLRGTHIMSIVKLYTWHVCRVSRTHGMSVVHGKSLAHVVVARYACALRCHIHS